MKQDNIDVNEITITRRDIIRYGREASILLAVLRKVEDELGAGSWIKASEDELERLAILPLALQRKALRILETNGVIENVIRGTGYSKIRFVRLLNAQ